MAGKAGRVIVIGSSNTDLVARCERLPTAGQTVLGGELRILPGGKGANQAVAAARAGAEVRFLGAFGDDDFGRARRRDLESDAVHAAGSVVKAGVPSGVALIAVGGAQKGTLAENLIVVAPGANALLSPADIRRGLPALGPRDVLVGSLEVPLPAIREAFRLARRAGALTILNPAPCPLGGLPADLLALSQILTPNEGEFRTLLGAKTGQDANTLAAGARLVRSHRALAHALFLVTRGAAGVDLLSADSAKRPFVRAPRVRALDTVGAGDCFNGCLAAALSRGARSDGSPPDLAELLPAVLFAVAAAAISVTRHGAQPSMPQRKEIERMVRRMRR